MSMAYVRGYRDPHMGLRIWSIVGRSVPHLSVMRVPMHVPKQFKAGKLLVAAFKLYSHFLLVARLTRNKSATVLVREFLTWPLLIASPFLFVHRHRTWFVCQHNIAFAHRKPSHRIALRMLRFLGFRFVLYEDTRAWRVVEPALPSPRGIRALPLPFPFELKPKDRDSDRPMVVIGFVGNFRREKSPSWAIQALTAALAASADLKDCKLLVGSPDQTFLDGFRSCAEVVGTDSYAAYLDALRRCDIVVLPYDPLAYSYRSSGVLAEAVACGCAVVTPDLPVLRDQVLHPAVVGACYASAEDFLTAVKSAVRLVRSGALAPALEAHQRLRGKAGVRTALMELTT